MHNTLIRKIKKTEPPKQLGERFMLESRAFLFPQFHFLFEAFDKKFQQYLEANLIEYNMRFWNEKQNLKKLEQHKEPFAVLTLGDLEAGFVVWLVPLGFSLFIFGIEWLTTTIKLISVLFAIKSLYKLKESEQEARSPMLKIKINLTLLRRWLKTLNTPTYTNA